MVESWTRGVKTMSRLGLAVAGAVLALAVAPIAAAQAGPTLTISSPAGVSGSHAVTFEGTTSDASVSDPITLTIDGPGPPIIENISPSAPGTWSFTPPAGLADGTYTVSAEQTQEGSLGSAGTSFVVNTRPPSVNVSTLSIEQESVVFGGHAGDEPGDGIEVSVQVFEQGASEAEPLQELHIARSGDGWESNSLELPPGNYSVRALQEGPPGHPGASSPRTFSITARAPTVALTTPEFAPQGGTLVSNTATPRFLAEPVSGIKGVTVDVYSGTSAVGEPIERAVMTPSGEVWSATLGQPLANGIYTAQAQVEDTHGDTGVSAPVIFSVQVPPPTIAPVSPGTSPPTASFTWIPATPTAGQSVSLVSNSTNGSSAIGAFAWDVAGNSSFAPGGSVMTTSFATAGSHVVHLRVTDGNGLSSVATRTIGVAPPALKLMQPFPIVRIAGAETGSGVKIRLLTVQTPLSTKVAVTCKGTGCKTKSESRVATASAKNKSKGGAILLTFAHFERPLRAGVILQIRVSGASQIGKFTSFKIRRHKLPLRSDSCLTPTSATPIACPTA